MAQSQVVTPEPVENVFGGSEGSSLREIPELRSPVESHKPAETLAPRISREMAPPLIQTWPAELLQTFISAAPLAIADLAVLTVCAGAAFDLSQWLLGLQGYGYLTAAAVMSHMIVIATLGLYHAGVHPVVELRRIVKGLGVSFLVLLASLVPQAGWQTQSLQLLGFTAIGWILSSTTLPLTRTLLRALLARIRWWGHPVMVVGDDESAVRTYERLMNSRSSGLRPIGAVGSQLFAHQHLAPAGIPHLGTLANVPAIMREHQAYWAIIALPSESSETIQKLVRSHLSVVPHRIILTDTQGLPSLWTQTQECAGAVGIRQRDRLFCGFSRMMKRTIDVVASLLGVIVLSPLFILIAIGLKLFDPGPILYAQARLGRHGRWFNVLKFRTMVVNNDVILKRYLEAHPEEMEDWKIRRKLKRDPRITWIGNLLRTTSMDELPQLLNVLRGEMSLVGPRPIYAAEVASYLATGSDLRDYIAVRPGVTGLWQVSGRGNTTYEERAVYNEYYVRNWSVWLDFYILVRTVRTVLLKEGAA